MRGLVDWDWERDTSAALLERLLTLEYKVLSLSEKFEE